MQSFLKEELTVFYFFNPFEYYPQCYCSVQRILLTLIPDHFFLHKSQLKGSLLVRVNAQESCYQVIKGIQNVDLKGFIKEEKEPRGPVLLPALYPAFVARLL